MSLVEVKIGDLGKVITGNTPPKKDPNNYGGAYPFIKPTDMDIDKRYVTEWDESYSEKAYKQYHRSYIPKGATGVVTIGTVGEKLFQAHQNCFTNQSVNVIIPNDKYYDDYVFYLMKLNLPKVESANPGTASGRHHVSKSNFCSIKLDVIESIDSQKRIADILSAYDDLIGNNLKRIKLLEQAAQNIYKEWFVNLRFPGHEDTPINEETGLPEGWEKKMFNDVSVNNNRKRIPVNGTDRSKRQGNYRYYGATGVMDYIDDYIFDGRFLLVAEDGTVYDKVGNAYTQLVEGKFWVNNHAHIISAGSLPVEYLYLAMKHYPIGHLITGAVQLKLSMKNLKRVEVINPSEEILEKFMSAVNPMINQVFKLNKQNQKLKAARDILLPRLMNRTIEV